MEKYICNICSAIYDPLQGVHSIGIDANELFEDLPDYFVCPKCGITNEFKRIEE